MERTAYDVWRALPFPAGSTVDEIDVAHADLAYWDAMTADAVVPVAEQSSLYDSGVCDFRAGLAALHERLVALREGTSGSEAEILDAYIGYADALGAVHDWAAGTRR